VTFSLLGRGSDRAKTCETLHIPVSRRTTTVAVSGVHFTAGNCGIYFLLLIEAKMAGKVDQGIGEKTAGSWKGSLRSIPVR
jgi:hypothetical protein